MDDEQPMIDPQDRHTYKLFCSSCERTLGGGNHVGDEDGEATVAAAKAWGRANQDRVDAFLAMTDPSNPDPNAAAFYGAIDDEQLAANALFALVDPGEGT